MRNTTERDIDGRTWTVTVFSATEGLGIMARLTRILGGPIGRAVAGALGPGGGEDGPSVDSATIAEAFEALADRLDEAEVVGLIKRMLRGTQVAMDDGKKVSAADRFDTVFMGAYATLFKVIGFVLEANYDIPLADWLGELPGLMAGGADETPDAS